MKPGARWPLIIGCALALHACAWLAIAFLAVSDPSFAVEEDYYRKALEWDKTQEQEERNDKLGWSVEVRTQPRSDGLTDFGVLVTDNLGEPVLNAFVAVEVFAVARSDHRRQSALVELGEGWYEAPLAMRRSGRWEIRVVANLGEKIFTAKLVEHLGLQPYQGGAE